MRRSNFVLRLQPSLLEELRKASESEGVALNQMINVAVAEKVSALRTEEYFRQRAARADRAESLRILEKAGRDNPPMERDDLPKNWRKRPRPKNPRRKLQAAARRQTHEPPSNPYTDG